MPTLMEKKDWMQTVANMGTASGVWSENGSPGGTLPTKRLKIGTMKDEIQLPENFDQEFEVLDDQVVSLFAGSASVYFHMTANCLPMVISSNMYD